MTVEIISWSISTKVWNRAGIKPVTFGSTIKLASVARHVTDYNMYATQPGFCLLINFFSVIYLCNWNSLDPVQSWLNSMAVIVSHIEGRLLTRVVGIRINCALFLNGTSYRRGKSSLSSCLEKLGFHIRWFHLNVNNVVTQWRGGGLSVWYFHMRPGNRRWACPTEHCHSLSI